MITKKCKVCDNEINCYPSTSAKNVYCSRKCKIEDTSKLFKCPQCGKEHRILNCHIPDIYFKKKFCSVDCYELFNKNLKDEKFLKTCNNCNRKFYSFRSVNKSGYFFCCQDCSKNFMKGENSYPWKGGTILTNGYKVIKVNRKYEYVHRIIIEKHIGRELKHYEIVHHKDGNKLNNELDNLELMTKTEHDRLHTELRNGKLKNTNNDNVEGFRVLC